jgi:hypothetical protein
MVAKIFEIGAELFALVSSCYLIFFIIFRALSARYLSTIKPSFITPGIIILWIIIAFPNFVKHVRLYPEVEAIANLRDLYESEQVYFEKHHAYPGGPHTFASLSWKPKFSKRYAYFCGQDRIVPRYLNGPALDDWLTTIAPIHPYSSADDFVCLAVGNMDFDNALDVWMMDQTGREKRLLSDRDNNLSQAIFVRSPHSIQFNWRYSLNELKTRRSLDDFLYLIFGALIPTLLSYLMYRDLRRFQSMWAEHRKMSDG